ncbi:MAG: nucleotide exchange factor GrpE [Microcoleaceae cyanobacterium]
MKPEHSDEMIPNPSTDTPEMTSQSEETSSAVEPPVEVPASESAEVVVEPQAESTEFSNVARPTEAEVVSEPAAGEPIETDAYAAGLEIDVLRAQLEDVNLQYRRLAADFENFRRRSQNEKEELEQRIKSSTIQKLLPVVDSFERARSHIKPETEAEETIHKSYQGVYKQMVDCLKQVGVSAMRPEGEMFDPQFHEAVMQQPTADHPEGTVTEELMRGYMFGDRVLRHAMVKVAAPPEPGTESLADQPEPGPEA